MSAPSGTVVLGFGPQPLTWLSSASKLCGKNAIVYPRIATMSGATMAVGDADVLALLAQVLVPGAIAAQKAKTPHLSEEAVAWLAAGERGMSSDSIFQHVTGVQTSKYEGHLPSWPHDCGDLRRCRELLAQVPEIEPLFREKMASASPEWAALMPIWDELCALDDAKDSDSVYAGIKTAISGARAAQTQHP